MPVWHYPHIRGVDPSKTAKAVIRDAPISYKEACEICKILRGMMLRDAKEFLKRVIEQREPVPIIRYKLGIAHKRGLSDRWPRWRTPIGRYPVKAAKYVLKLLENVENNAVNVKNLNLDKLKIVHIAAHRGPYRKKWMPRAFGRATPWFGSTASIEVIVAEV